MEKNTDNSAHTTGNGNHGGIQCMRTIHDWQVVYNMYAHTTCGHGALFCDLSLLSPQWQAWFILLWLQVTVLQRDATEDTLTS